MSGVMKGTAPRLVTRSEHGVRSSPCSVTSFPVRGRKLVVAVAVARGHAAVTVNIVIQCSCSCSAETPRLMSAA